MQCLLEQADLSDADARLQVKAMFVNNANAEESARPTKTRITAQKSETWTFIYHVKPQLFRQSTAKPIQPFGRSLGKPRTST